MSAPKAAPKTFNQLKNVGTITAFLVGGWYGRQEYIANQAAWADFHKKQWAANVKAAEDKAAYEKSLRPPEPIPEIVPEELHEVYNEIKL